MYSTSRLLSRTTSIPTTPIPVLPSSTLPTFRAALQTSKPALLPRGTFTSLPAIQHWTTRTHPPTFSRTYLAPFADTLLPTELTTPGAFTRADAPFGTFLDWADLASKQAQSQSHDAPRLTIAQAPRSQLPAALREDVPVPELVLNAGSGDVYADSIWLGVGRTSTPLHRDPNPNLLVQLAGRKRVRLISPADGDAVWARVRERVGGGSSRARGEEMMRGAERGVLEGLVWGDGETDGVKGEELGTLRDGVEMWEGEIAAGDGIFIPLGWWHAVRGMSKGAVASVNWWFR